MILGKSLKFGVKLPLTLIKMTIIKLTLNKYLYAMLGRSELIDQWWDSPNKAFDNKTPNEIYLSGEEGRKKVADYIMFHASGQY
jgi:hypothetical protein